MAITDAFMKRYPGIKATYWQGRNPEIVTRVLTEFQGGQSSVDVILSDNAPPVIRAAGGIMPYDTVQKEVLVLHDPDIGDRESADPGAFLQHQKDQTGRSTQELGGRGESEIQGHGGFG